MEDNSILLLFNFELTLLQSCDLLVEAAGFEPASESTTSKRLHAYSAYLVFRTRFAGKIGFPGSNPS